MKTSWFGFTIAALVLYFGVFKGSPNAAIFLDPHALIIVFGGTFAAALIALPWSQLDDICYLVLFGMLIKKKFSKFAHAKDLIRLGILFKAGRISKFRPYRQHPFMNEAMNLLIQKDIDVKNLKYILEKRSDFFRKKYSTDAKALSALAKFPPAFGLLGASTGMIAMMSNMGQGNQDLIGSAMAIALVATFWGISIANLIILPLADFANRAINEDQDVRKMIIEGMVAIKLKVNSQVLLERILTYLPPDDREDLNALVAKVEQAIDKEVVNIRTTSKRVS